MGLMRQQPQRYHGETPLLLSVEGGPCRLGLGGLCTVLWTPRPTHNFVERLCHSNRVSGNIGKEEMGLVKKKREPTLCPADTSVLLMLPMDTVIVTGIM